MQNMSDLKKLFGQNLRKIRKKHNLTQEQLAEKIDISLPNISYIENGKTYPSVDTQEKLCKILKIKYQDLYAFDELPTVKEMKMEILNAIKEKPAIIEKLYRFYKFYD